MTAKNEQCFYCGALVSKGLTGDHFPIPKNAGGRLTVSCCITCHDMKDRFTLESWPSDWIAKIVEDFPKLNRETRLFLAKAMQLFAESIAEERLLFSTVTSSNAEEKYAKFIEMSKKTKGRKGGGSNKKKVSS